MNRIHSQDLMKVENALQAVRKVPKAITCRQYRFHALEDTLFYLETIVSSIFVNEKEYLYLATRDISRRRQAELALQAANEKPAREEKVSAEKNIALKEILNQIDEEKKQINIQLQSNISRLISPVLQTLYERAGETDRLYIRFIKSCLRDITSPFINSSRENLLRTRVHQIRTISSI